MGWKYKIFLRHRVLKRHKIKGGDELSSIFNVQVNESAVLEMCKERIGMLIREAEGEFVYWDASELKRRTCMSWNTIQDTFFFDQRFIKRKIGGKWYFPAKEAREFLTLWLQEQPK